MDEALADKVAFGASEILLEESLVFEHFDSHKKDWDDSSKQGYKYCYMDYTVACFGFPHNQLAQIAQTNSHCHYTLPLAVVNIEDS